MKQFITIFVLAILSGCGMPNTYYSITDDYARGLRWYDRGDYESAIRYWEPLVINGDCDAEYQIGLIYFLGHGKEQNTDKAITLWSKAANGNQQKAQITSGDIYSPYNKEKVFYCKICKKDIVQAHVWYKLAEKSAKYDGEKRYLKHIFPKIESMMTTEELTKSKALVSQWKPTPKDCNARDWW